MLTLSFSKIKKWKKGLNHSNWKLKDQIEPSGKGWKFNCNNGGPNWWKQWECRIKLKKDIKEWGKTCKLIKFKDLIELLTSLIDLI